MFMKWLVFHLIRYDVMSQGLIKRNELKKEYLSESQERKPLMCS